MLYIMNRYNDNILICKFLFFNYMLDDVLFKKGEKYLWILKFSKILGKGIIKILRKSVM